MAQQENQLKLEPSTSAEFDELRMQQELRYHDVQEEVFGLRKQWETPKKLSEQESTEKPGNYIETNDRITWHYDMLEFPFGNINVQLKNRVVLIHAHRMSKGNYYEINREFLLPNHAKSSKLTAKITPNGILYITVPTKTSGYDYFDSDA